MKPIRVLVTGSAGQVGLDFLDALAGVTPRGGDENFMPDGRRVDHDEFEVLGLTRRDLDITNHDAVMRAVRACEPHVIVNLAAYTAVDRAEAEGEACYAINSSAVESLSTAAKERAAHLITISTDYVFDGDKGDAYVEEDETNPANVYGASKRAGEMHCSPEDTVVRTSWVMGVRGKNVLHVIAERAKAGQTVRFVNDQMGTATLASDLARALVTMVRVRPGGVWHVANSGAATWFEIAQFAGATLGRGGDFATPITTGELDPAPLATRPTRSDLNTDKWLAQGWQALPEWRDGVERLLAGRVLQGDLRP